MTSHHDSQKAPPDKKVAYQGRKIQLVTFPITLPGGTPYDMELFEHPGASAIVALDDAGVTLIHQYRYAAGGFIWEVPAGTLDGGEPPLDCAKRELVEEAGFTAASWTPLGHIFTVPSFCDETIYLFLAEGLSAVDTAHEVDEVIDDIRQVPLDEALAWIDEGKICDAKSIAALTRASRLLARRDG